MTTRDPEIWMWAQACEMLERAERLQRQFFQRRAVRRRPTWEPPVDVFETERSVWILVALPGVDPELVSVGFEDGMLVVSGEMALPAELRSARIHRFEIPHGAFERRVELPAGTYQVDRREMIRGCLLVHLLKAA